MSRIVGIDIRHNFVQAALLRTGYRKVHLEALADVERRQYDSLGEAVAAVVSGFGLHGEAIAVGIGGDGAFIHRLQLPPAALKQVHDVVPFELEAQIPIDFDTLVYDSRLLPREGPDSKIEVMGVAAPIARVREYIADVSSALHHEPERIGVGALPLGNLAQVLAEVRDQQFAAIVDLGEESSELAIVHHGTAVFARTLSVGVAGLPDSAPDMVRELKQTLVSWSADSEHPIDVLYLCGGGALAVGIVEYLEAHLGCPVAQLPGLRFESVKPEYAAMVPRFAKAIALALSLRAGASDLNLRQGPLTYQRGYGFLKDKIPLLVGLGAVVLMSFLFSAWAESRALASENDALAEAMAILSKEILEEETYDVEEVLDLLDTGMKSEKDPQPEIDGFGLAVALAEQIPKDYEHDIAELDLQRGHVKLTGLVNDTEHAQKIAEALKERRCFQDVKILKISQQVKSERQKYAMEFNVKCQDAKKPAADEEEEDEE
jgi:general secretion pathway protein L